MFGRHVPRLALHVGAEADHPVAEPLGGLRGGVERGRRGRHDLVFGLLEDRIARLRRLVGRIVQRGLAGGRQVDAALFDDCPRISERRCVRHGGSGGDDARIVAGHVGDRQGDQPRLAAGMGEAPALDLRQMLAHAVDLADAGAAAQHRLRHGLLVGKRNALGRQQPVGRAATGNQRQHEVVRPGRFGERDHLRRRRQPVFVGQRMPGLDHRDRPGVERIAVAGDRDAGEPVGGHVMRLRVMGDRGGGHRGGSLAGGEDDDAPRRRRKMRGENARRMRRRNGRLEDRRQVPRPSRRVHANPSPHRPGASIPEERHGETAQVAIEIGSRRAEKAAGACAHTLAKWSQRPTLTLSQRPSWVHPRAR